MKNKVYALHEQIIAEESNPYRKNDKRLTALRNRVFAQVSRIKQSSKYVVLYDMNVEKDSKRRDLNEIIIQNLTPEIEKEMMLAMKELDPFGCTGDLK